MCAASSVYIHCFNFVGCLSLKLDDILNRVVSFIMPWPTVAMLDGDNFLLPAKCRFLLSDISHVRQLLSGKLQVYAVSVFITNVTFMRLFHAHALAALFPGLPG